MGRWKSKIVGMKGSLLFLSAILSLGGFSYDECSKEYYKEFVRPRTQGLTYKEYRKASYCDGVTDKVDLDALNIKEECQKEVHMPKVVQDGGYDISYAQAFDNCIKRKESEGRTSKADRRGDRERSGNTDTMDRELGETFNLQTHLNATCSKHVKIGSMTCYCDPKRTLDFQYCEEYAQAIKRASASLQANELTTGALAQITGNQDSKDINRLAGEGEDTVVPGYDAVSGQANIQMQGQGTSGAISASLAAYLSDLGRKWITPNNLSSRANCGENEACTKAVKEALSDTGSSFPNQGALNHLYASIKSSSNNFLSAFQQAADSLKSMQQIKRQKEAYLNTLATEDTTSYACTVNPALCEEDDSTNKQAPGTGHSGIGFGGGYTSGSLGSVDDTNGSSDYSSNTTYNAPSDDTSFENEEVAALAPSFDNSPQGSPSGASGASANSSGGGSTPTAREQKMAQQKKLKSMNIDGKSFYRKKKKKRSRFGSTGSNVPKFEDPLKGKNPFAGLFGNKGAKKSKKEVNRALANDGVKRSSNSLFKRITRAHIRKVKNRELLVYRIQ